MFYFGYTLMNYSLAGFHTTTKDHIIQISGGWGALHLIMQGEIESKGIEMALGMAFPYGFYVNLDYTYQCSEFTDYKTTTASFDGKRVPLVPDYFLGSNLGWVNEKYGRIDVSIRYVDDKYIARENTDKLDDYTVADAKYTYSYKNLEVSFAVNNLFDKTYAEYGIAEGGFYVSNVPVAWPADGRNYLGTVSYHF